MTKTVKKSKALPTHEKAQRMFWAAKSAGDVRKVRNIAIAIMKRAEEAGDHDVARASAELRFRANTKLRKLARIAAGVIFPEDKVKEPKALVPAPRGASLQKEIGALRKQVAAVQTPEQALDARDRATLLAEAAKLRGTREELIETLLLRADVMRSIGKMLKQLGDEGRLAKGGGAPGRDSTRWSPRTLKKMGIDKHLADDARKYAAIDEERWPGIRGQWAANAREAERVPSLRLLLQDPAAKMAVRQADWKERIADPERAKSRAAWIEEWDTHEADKEEGEALPAGFRTEEAWLMFHLNQNTTVEGMPATIDTVHKVVARGLAVLFRLRALGISDQKAAERYFTVVGQMEERINKLATTWGKTVEASTAPTRAAS